MSADSGTQEEPMHRSLVLVTLTALSAGCAPPVDMLDVLPDERIQVNLPVGSDAAKAVGGDKEWATFYLFTHDVTDSINPLIAGVLYWVHTITSTYPPTW